MLLETDPRTSPASGARDSRRPRLDVLSSALLLIIALWLPSAVAGGSWRGADLGLTLRPDPDRHGYLVTAVASDSVAAVAGLRQGDVLVDASLGGPPVTLCPDEPEGSSNLRRALANPATHLGRLRPGAPQHEQYQRVDIGRAVEEIARRQRARPREKRADPETRPATEGKSSALTRPVSIELQPASVRDPELNGLASHTLLVPAGWRVTGAPIWNLGTPTNLVTLDVTVQGTDGEQVRFFPGEVHTFTDSPLVQQQMGARVGARLPTGVIFMPPPDSITQHVMRDVLPALRPATSSVRLVSSKPMPELQQGFEELYASVFEQGRRMDAQWQQEGSGRASVGIEAGMVRVAYEEAGKPYEEEIFAAYLRTDFFMSGQGIMPDTWNASWQRVAGSSARAPAGSLEPVLPMALAVGRSLRQTPRWSAIVADLHMQLSAARHRATMDQLRRQRESLAKSTESLSDIQYEGWKKRQASEDRLQRSFVNSIHGVDDFVRNDGTNVSLPDGYGRVYYSPTRGYLLTNDELLQPNVDLETKNWEPVLRAER